MPHVQLPLNDKRLQGEGPAALQSQRNMEAQAYRNYMLVVLTAIMAFNYVDRLALGLLLQDIKSDLMLSDTQLGILSGIAFALFYSVMGLPIARWADSGNRIRIVTVTTALWSVAVSLCGLAGSFLQLVAIRVGVAVGEAGCLPPAHSLIADYFSRAERPRAVAFYMLGQPISIVIGFFAAGWLNEFFGWRTTFVSIGLPGVVLAGLAWFTLREPRLTKPNDVAGDFDERAPASAPPSAREVLKHLWANATFRHLLIAFSVAFFFSYGMGQWQPAFFVRSYGLQTGELGTWYALVWGMGGLLGTYLGGELASRFAANNERLQLLAISIMYVAFGIVSASVYIAPNKHLAFALMGLAAIGGTMVNGPLFATIQSLVPAHMRAVSISVIYLFANLIGMGLGPLAVGALSDVLRPALDEESLRYALLALSPGYLWAAWHLWRASRSVTGDLPAANMQQGEQGHG